MAARHVTLAGAAGGWLTFPAPNNFYLLGAMLIVIGIVIQDVVADAMSTEVVARVDAAGNAPPDHDVAPNSAWSRYSAASPSPLGILAVAGLSGWLAQHLQHETVFLIGLVIPAISVSGVLLIRRNRRAAADRLAHPRRRHRLRRLRACARLGGVPLRPG